MQLAINWPVPKEQLTFSAKAQHTRSCTKPLNRAVTGWCSSIIPLGSGKRVIASAWAECGVAAGAEVTRF